MTPSLHFVTFRTSVGWLGNPQPGESFVAGRITFIHRPQALAIAGLVVVMVRAIPQAEAKKRKTAGLKK
jgi:hypothetical protein